MKNEAFLKNTEGKTVFHLTHTGPCAGHPFCGVNRANEPTVQYFHGVYAPEAVWTDERLCPQCKAFWDSTSEE